MSANNDIHPIAVPEQRQIGRSPVELKTIVQVKESDVDSWKEITKVTTVSRNGAGFSLPRPVAVGRLLTLVMPLDPELRAYDEKEELYPVMGIVQYCNEGMVDGKTVYHVGVGFTGKKVPESFKQDPTQSYRIVGMNKSGLWEIIDAESKFKNRTKPRYWISFPATVTLLQKAENSGAKEETSTKNISAGGVSVFCSLDTRVGEKVKFSCKQLDFYSIAIVRDQKQVADEVPTLHLEFVDTEFPIDRIISARTPVVTS